MEQPNNDFVRDYSKMYTKEMFLKGVIVCAIECVFFINVVKTI
jgi:hypothetical protein